MYPGNVLYDAKSDCISLPLIFLKGGFSTVSPPTFGRSGADYWLIEKGFFVPNFSGFSSQKQTQIRCFFAGARRSLFFFPDALRQPCGAYFSLPTYFGKPAEAIFLSLRTSATLRSLFFFPDALRQACGGSVG